MLKYPLHTAEVAGLARPFDFLIVLPRHGCYEEMTKGKIEQVFPLLAHEWTHYFQFLSTNLGNLLAELSHQLYFSRFELIMSLGVDHAWDFKVPAARFLNTMPSARSSRVDETIEILAHTQDALSAAYRPFVAQNKAFPEPWQKIYLTDDGQLSCGDKSWQLSILQILEHAAMTSECQLTLGVLPESFWMAELADYSVLYWYLHQQNVINVDTEVCDAESTGTKGFRITRCSFDPDPLAVPMVFFLLTQIALNIAEFEIYNFKRDSSDSHSHKIRVPSRFAQQLYSRAISVFSVFINNFHHIGVTVGKMISKGNSWLAAADRVCEEYGLPLYSKSIEIGVRRLKAYEMTINSQNNHPLLNGKHDNVFSEALNVIRSSLKITMRDAMISLTKTPEASANPIYFAGSIPMPYVVAFSRNGSRRRLAIRFPWQNEVERFLEIPKHVQSFLIEDYRIVEGLIFDECVACYPPSKSKNHAAANCVWACEMFEDCWERKQQSVTFYCKNPQWQDRVSWIEQALIKHRSIKSNNAQKTSTDSVD